jgi:hypothetical protein
MLARPFFVFHAHFAIISTICRSPRFGKRFAKAPSPTF